MTFPRTVLESIQTAMIAAGAAEEPGATSDPKTLLDFALTEMPTMLLLDPNRAQEVGRALSSIREEFETDGILVVDGIDVAIDWLHIAGVSYPVIDFSEYDACGESGETTETRDLQTVLRAAAPAVMGGQVFGIMRYLWDYALTAAFDDGDVEISENFNLVDAALASMGRETLNAMRRKNLDSPRDRAIYTVSRADILDIARCRGIELTREELERAVAELTRSHMGDDLDGTMCEYIDDAIDRIEERRRAREGLEPIAVGVGNCFRVVPTADTDGIDLVPSALTIEYGGETYELMRGATYEDSRAIDDILDRKGELYIDDYNPSPVKPANRPKR